MEVKNSNLEQINKSEQALDETFKSLENSDIKTNYDLLHTDIDVLASLYFNGKDYIMSPTELYDALILSSGGMTKVLKKLQDRGLIKRDSVTNDKRKNLVCLTQKGIELTEEIMDNKALMVEKSFSVLDKKEKENLKNILSKVLYSLN